MRLQKLILPALGLLFAGLGALVVWYFAPSFNQAAAQIERLSPLTAATLAESPAGQASLIEGRIGESNPAQFRLFVAYVRYEYRGRDDDGDDDDSNDKVKWVEDERVTPPLLLDLPGGQAQVVNKDYSLQGQRVIWQSDSSLTWDSWSGEGTKSYEGFERGNPVLALGTVVEGATGPEFRAEWLYGGSRAGYIEEQHSAARTARWVGLAFMGVGTAILGLGLWIWFKV